MGGINNGGEGAKSGTYDVTYDTVILLAITLVFFPFYFPQLRLCLHVTRPQQMHKLHRNLES